MTELTIENAKKITPGQVVKFYLIDKHGNPYNEIGVVFANNHLGIYCNREDNGYFFFGYMMFNGKIKFEILDEHSPVAIYSMGYDFVSKHE